MRDIKFQFIYKGLPYSSINKGFNWHKKVYSLDDFVHSSLYELSDIHGACELVAKRQFTGLTDKNGVEIYEGDLVKWGHVEGYIESTPRIAKVNLHPALNFETVNLGKNNHRFHYGSFAYARFINRAMEVIGNIHQNPELTGEQQ
jgi:uncharacterized phage protein (TIGR01671 family)